MAMNLIVSCSSKKKKVLIKTYWSYDSIWYGTKNSFPIINDMEKISDLKFSIIHSWLQNASIVLKAYASIFTHKE